MEKSIPFVKGLKHFKEVIFPKNEEEFVKLVKEGQHPEALFITCSDSRILPVTLTGAKAGELFVVRDIGNIVPPFKPEKGFHGIAAAVEYAVSVLNVPHIIICGHSHCGACKALYKELPDSIEYIHIKKWLTLGDEVKEKALEMVPEKSEELYRVTEKLNILKQIESLLTYPAVKERVEKGLLKIHGWYYVMEKGEIFYFNPEKEEFVPAI